MATKVQSKSYLPGYHSMQDIKEDATSGWSSFYQDKLSDHIYETYVPRLVNGYSEPDKEMLKQTMLEHEAIFRKQVYELHRLYRIQKDLMDEFQSRGFHTSSIPAEASHSNSFSSQRQSEHTEKTSQVSSRFPGGSASYGKIPFAVNEKSQFNHKRENKVRSDQLSFMNGTCQKYTEEVINDKPEKKRTFDLHLPADVYIDIDVDDSDGSEQINVVDPSHSTSLHKNGTCSLYSESDTKLTLGNGHNDQQISNSAILINKSACGTVDLNEPTTEISSESPANSASDQLHGWKTYSEYGHGHNSSMRSNANFMVRHGDQQIPPALAHKDAHINGGWSYPNHESGKNRITQDKFAWTCYHNNVPTLSETVQLNAKQPRESFPFERSTPGTSSRQEPTQEVKTSLRFPHFTCSNSSLVSPSVPSAIITPTDLSSCTSSFVSSWRRPSSSKDSLPVAGQALPCFSGSSNLSNDSLSSKKDAQGPISYCQKWRSSRDIRTTIVGTDVMVPHMNAFHNGLHLDSNSIKMPKVVSCKVDQTDDCKANLHGHLPGSNHLKYSQSIDLKAPINLNLNQAFPSDIEDKLSCDVNDNLSVGPSWLKKDSFGESIDAKKPSILDFSFSDGQLRHISSSDAVASDTARKEERDLDLSIRNQQKVASALQFRYHQMQGNEVFDNGKKTTCVPIHENNKQGNIADCNGHMKKQSTDTTGFMEANKMFSDWSSDTKTLNSQNAVQTDNKVSKICGAKSSAGFKSQINLNVDADDPMSSEIVPQGEASVRSSSKSISIFGAKISSDTDLEAPKSDSANQHMYNQSRKEDYGSDEKEYLCDTLVRLAADNLVSISMASKDHSDESGSCSLSLPQFSTLSWFAGVVSSTAENPETVGGGGDGYGDRSLNDNHDDGLDLFEAMTLQLEEVKEDQHWCTPKQDENKHDDDGEKEDKDVPGAASLLFTKPRRGQARKRRQRRDFQKDILPGLASLSRHEVSEDLQTIGGMMKALGRHWHTSLTRRNAGRNGAKSQTKGRKQPRSLAITAEEEVEVTLPPQEEPSQLSNPEMGCVNGSSMIGWGRTTRRCRRQRCIPGSLPAPLA